MHMLHIVAVSKLMTRNIHDLQLGEALSTYQGEKWQQPCRWGKCRTQYQQLFVGLWRALWAKVQVSMVPQVHHLLHAL